MIRGQLPKRDASREKSSATAAITEQSATYNEQQNNLNLLNKSSNLNL